MAVNSLYPGFVKIKYTSVLGEHFKIYPVHGWGEAIPGELPEFTRPSAAPIAMNTAIDAWVALAKPFFGNSMNLVYAEAWKIDEVGEDPHFIYSYEIGELGNSGTATVSMLQVVMSYRTSMGGLFKDYYMDASGYFPVNTKDPYPYTAASREKDMSDYITSEAGSWIVGRDGSRAISPINLTTKTNDALRKDRVLDQ